MTPAVLWNFWPLLQRGKHLRGLFQNAKLFRLLLTWLAIISSSIEWYLHALRKKMWRYQCMYHFLQGFWLFQQDSRSRSMSICCNARSRYAWPLASKERLSLAPEVLCLRTSLIFSQTHAFKNICYKTLSSVSLESSLETRLGVE